MRARRSGNGTGVPGGTKRTPCCASTTPALASRRLVGDCSGHRRGFVLRCSPIGWRADCAEAGPGQGSYVRESFEVATADVKLQLEVARPATYPVGADSNF